MEKEKVFMNEGVNINTTWNSCSDLNYGTEQLRNSFFNPNWENSLDQSDPFESALSSIVSSPAASNANANANAIDNGGDSIMIRELIGRLGNICNSGDISPLAYIKGNNNSISTNTSCYTSPLNSPPKLNLSIMDSQIRGNLPNHPCLAPFAADPGFAERAARFSCFGTRLNETQRLTPRVASGSQMNIQENKSPPQDVNSVSDRKFGRLSRSTTPDKADSREESSVSEHLLSGELNMKGQNDHVNARKRKSIPRGKAKETPSANDAKVAAENDESTGKRSKTDESSGNDKDTSKASAKSEENGNQKQNIEPEAPKDYIHVRARRGQATDSHSLAERVRREKISERMKFLQDLVPGCNKVTGKAVMLDEIINYVQSLQRQVEFLSMKLATVNPRMDINMEALLSKDIFQSRRSLPHNLYPLDSSASVFPFGYQPPQGLPLHSGMPNNAETQFSMNPLNAALRRNPSMQMQLPPVEGFGDATPQVTTFWEDDLQSVVQMGFGQNQPQSFHGK